MKKDLGFFNLSGVPHWQIVNEFRVGEEKLDVFQLAVEKMTSEKLEKSDFHILARLIQ